MPICDDNNNRRICDKSHSLTIKSKDCRLESMGDHRFFSGSKFPQYFFSVLIKHLCRHSSLVPKPCIKALVHRLRSCLPRLHLLVTISKHLMATMIETWNQNLSFKSFCTNCILCIAGG